MIRQRLSLVFLPVFLTFLGFAQTQSYRPYIQQLVDAVSRDSLMSHILRLEGFGPRSEFRPNRDSAASHIFDEFNRWGLHTESDHFVWAPNRTISGAAFLNGESVCLVGARMIVFSSDNGQTWQTSNPPVLSSFYDVDFVDEDNGWVVGSQDLLKTTNRGASWALQTVGPSRMLRAVSFVDRLHGCVAGQSSSIARTTDGGATWQAVAVQAIELCDVEMVDSLRGWAVGLKKDPLIIEEGLILATTDGGASWQEQFSGVSSRLLSLDMLSCSNGWVVGSNSLVLHTLDGGVTWERDSTLNWPESLYSVSFGDSMNGWILTWELDILKTNDAGQTWVKINAVASVSSGERIAARDANCVFVTGGSGMCERSTDAGKTWHTITPQLPSEFIQDSRNIVATIPGRLTPNNECIIVGHYDTVHLSPGANDNGTGTSAVMEAARICSDYEFAHTIRFLAVSAEEDGLLGSGHYAQEAMRQGRSIMGVVNGDMIGYPVRGDTTELVVASHRKRIPLLDSALVFNSRYGIGVRIRDSIDMAGASDHVSFALAGFPALLVAEATAKEIGFRGDPYYHSRSDTHDKLHPGLIRRAAQLMLATIAELAQPLRPTTSIAAVGERPTEFRLEQNFPNPFNPKTVVSYQLPVASKVQLIVYDLLGREIATLVDENKSAGVHSVQFDAAGLASGVYLYRMQAGTFVETRRLLLLR